MLDVLVSVYSITQKQSHLDLVHHFDRRWFRDLLASNNDQLGANAEHSNTELPVVVGLANLATTLLTPPQSTVYTTAVLHFLGWMQTAHEFVTGGVSGKSAYPAPLDYNSELFNSAKLLDRQINGTPGHPGQQCGESCCAHNLQKSTMYAFAWTHSCRWADEFEKRYVNCVMAQQQPTTGQFLYNLNLKQAATKGYGTPWDSFWCCYGTGVDAYAQLAHGAAYNDNDRAVWLVNYTASTITWEAHGLSLLVDTQYPQSGAVKLTLTLAQELVQLILNLRIPSWATDSVTLLLNGKPIVGVTITPGTFVAIDRQWNSGDVIELDLPFSLYAEPIPDRCEYVGVKYGPHVLVACGPADATFTGSAAQLLTSLSPTADPCTFTTTLQGPLRPQTVTYKPIANIVDESYNGYTLVSRPPIVHVVDSVEIGSSASEQAHDFTSSNSTTGTYGGLVWRDAQQNGYLSYRLAVSSTQPTYLRCMYDGDDTGNDDTWRLFDVQVAQADGSWLTIATQSLDQESPGQWYKVVYPIPQSLTAGMDSLLFRFQAKGMNGVRGTAGGFFDAIQTYTQSEVAEADNEDAWLLVAP